MWSFRDVFLKVSVSTVAQKTIIVLSFLFYPGFSPQRLQLWPFLHKQHVLSWM